MTKDPLTVTVDVVLTPEARRVLDLATTWQGNCPSCGQRYNALDRNCSSCGAQLPAAEKIAIEPNPYWLPDAGGIQPSALDEVGMDRETFERNLRSWLGGPT